MSICNVVEPKGRKRPVLISVPHSGVGFPEEVRGQFLPEVLDTPEDTDWHVHTLYSFAAELGITLIHAHYSRYVIDLNRNPENKKLYSDNRVQFDLVPAQRFNLKSLYLGEPPNQEEVELRKRLYYFPYYERVQSLLNDLQQEFKEVLLFDAHSIRHSVEAIECERFPDLTLGDQDGSTAGPELIDIARKHLSGSDYSFSHNSPFKGGNITRHFGHPNKNQHALQLEMVQDLYMNEARYEYQPEKAQNIQALLISMFEELANHLEAK